MPECSQFHDLKSELTCPLQQLIPEFFLRKEGSRQQKFEGEPINEN